MSGYVKDHAESCMLRQPMPRQASEPEKFRDMQLALRLLIKTYQGRSKDLEGSTGPNAWMKHHYDDFLIELNHVLFGEYEMPPAEPESETKERNRLLTGLVRSDHAYLSDLLEAGNALYSALERHHAMPGYSDALRVWLDTQAEGGRALAAIKNALMTPEAEALVQAAKGMVRALENYREAPVMRAGPHPLADGLDGLQKALKAFP